jgi:hypothetical protein
MFVLQFCWLTVVWIDTYLIIPFTETFPLKYSVGYNYPFIPSNESFSLLHEPHTH